MRAGELRHVIVIQTPTEVNTGGEIITTWTEYDEVRAKVMPQRGSEYWSAKQIVDEEPTLFKIRYLADTTAKMRVLFNEKAYDIKHVQNVEERNREMILVTTVTVPKYPQFDYHNINVSDGETAGTMIFTWTTDACASSRIRWKEHDAIPWTYKDEQDTDPTVISHSVTQANFKASEYYLYQVYSENRDGWTPGWSDTYYFATDEDKRWVEWEGP